MLRRQKHVLSQSTIPVACNPRLGSLVWASGKRAKKAEKRATEGRRRAKKAAFDRFPGREGLVAQALYPPISRYRV